MKVFIAGIGGTFMAALAQLARELGCEVRGCDDGVYAPMSTLLAAAGIDALPGYLPAHLGDDPGRVLIGNALSRGNPLVEHVLAGGFEYLSGPEWLRQEVLAGRRVVAVAGTHGKTTTSAMLAWILHCHGAEPGYLIGGKPGNFARSATLGGRDDGVFVLEADEYDTAFFDKRAKFVHYRPQVAVLNNLEFDHADIYDDLAQIERQFHHLIRTVPANGRVIVNADDARLAAVLAMGCWSEVVRFSIGDADAEWHAQPSAADCSGFDVLRGGRRVARVEWACIGRHNMQNALAAVVAAVAVGVPTAVACDSLGGYVAVARRLQLVAAAAGVAVYDDFAHHPSAIRETLAALRARYPGGRLVAVVELRSNSMRMGVHGDELAAALAGADLAIVSGEAGLAAVAVAGGGGILALTAPADIIEAIQAARGENDIIVTMSNGDFGGLAGRIADALSITTTTTAR